MTKEMIRLPVRMTSCVNKQGAPEKSRTALKALGCERTKPCTEGRGKASSPFEKL